MKTLKVCAAAAALVIPAAAALLARPAPLAIPAVEVAQPPEATAAKMAEAARAFLDGLSPELRGRAHLDYADARRLVWHYYPRVPWQRTGVTLKELDAAQKERFFDLVRAGTSAAGFETVTNLMQLEGVLRDIENTPAARELRDPERFHLTVFGPPSATGRWYWKLEGHHLLLSYVLDGGRVVSGTPFVFGANPGRVPSGPQRGLRILPRQEDLGRQLYTALDRTQRTWATLAGGPPFDVVTNADTRPQRLAPAGLPFTRMSEAQQRLVEAVLGTYTGLLPPAVEKLVLAGVRKAGMGDVHFGWSGSAEPGKPHYYRLAGPTFVVEYCNAQNDGNHIHVVWRDFDNDFAGEFPAPQP